MYNPITKKSFKAAAAAFAFTALMLGAKTTKAQTHGTPNAWRLDFGVEPGVLLTSSEAYNQFTLGGSARLQYDIKENFSLMLTGGYTHYFAKDQIVFQDVIYKPKDQSIIPVKVGAKIFIPHRIYFSGEVGAGFETGKYGSTDLILSPGIGYAASSGVDIGARYERYSANGGAGGMMSLRIAYGFKL
jgi:hypothetical protein